MSETDLCRCIAAKATDWKELKQASKISRIEEEKNKQRLSLWLLCFAWVNPILRSRNHCCIGCMSETHLCGCIAAKQTDREELDRNPPIRISRALHSKWVMTVSHFFSAARSFWFMAGGQSRWMDQLMIGWWTVQQHTLGFPFLLIDLILSPFEPFVFLFLRGTSSLLLSPHAFALHAVFVACLSVLRCKSCLFPRLLLLLFLSDTLDFSKLRGRKAELMNEFGKRKGKTKMKENWPRSISASEWTVSIWKMKMKQSRCLKKTEGKKGKYIRSHCYGEYIQTANKEEGDIKKERISVMWARDSKKESEVRWDKEDMNNEIEWSEVKQAERMRDKAKRKSAKWVRHKVKWRHVTIDEMNRARVNVEGDRSRQRGRCWEWRGRKN